MLNKDFFFVCTFITILKGIKRLGRVEAIKAFLRAKKLCIR